MGLKGFTAYVWLRIYVFLFLVDYPADDDGFMLFYDEGQTMADDVWF